jgi:Zn-dependent protease with chaperone function
MSGWCAANYLLGWLLSREHDFPKSTVAFEAERSLVLQIGGALITLSPAITVGLDLKTRAIASLLAVAFLSASIAAGSRVFQIVGLIESLPDFLVRDIEQRAPGVRGFALRSSAPNAYAIPSERIVMVSTGALQCVTPDGLRAIVAHELQHVKDGPRNVSLRRALSVLPTAVSIAIALIPRGNVPAWLFATFITSWFLESRVGKSSVAREKKADRAALRAQPNDGDYARALLELHRAWLIPATLSGRRTHPNLYERLERAGLVPDFPKPSPPALSILIWVPFVSGLALLTFTIYCLSR